MANEIKAKVDTGAIRVHLGDEFDEELGSFKFIPTDLGIIERYDNVMKEFEKMEFDETDEIEGFKKLSNQVLELFDFLLNYKVSDTLFAKCNPLTVVNNGDFYFETCLETIGGIIEDTFNERLEKKKARIKKATAKYTKKR